MLFATIATVLVLNKNKIRMEDPELLYIPAFIELFAELLIIDNVLRQYQF